MVLWWIISAAIAAAAGGIGMAYFGGRASGLKTVVKESTTAGGSGILTGLFNLLFGDVVGILNKAIYWAILVIILYLVIKLLMNWSRNRKTSKVKYSDQHHYHHKD